MKLSRGDVVLCKVPMPSEEFRGFKFCTSNISRIQEPTQYLIEGDEIVQAGIKVASVIKCESLLTINKSMIIKILGMLSNNGIRKVNWCLKDALELKED